MADNSLAKAGFIVQPDQSGIASNVDVASINLDASARGGNSTESHGSDAIGGDAHLLMGQNPLAGAAAPSAGTLDLTGGVTINASGLGGRSFTEVNSADGGDGTGGQARVVIADGTAIIGGLIDMEASGTGGDPAGGQAGGGFGGFGELRVDGGSLTASGDTVIVVDATGGEDFGFGGSAEAGDLAIGVSARGGTLTLTTGLIATALATAGDGLLGGGTALGGTIDFTVAAGSFISDGVTLNVEADGGTSDGAGAAGGDGIGGEATVTIGSLAASATADFGGSLSMFGNAFSGEGGSGAGTVPSAGGAAGEARGGTLAIFVGSANGGSSLDANILRQQAFGFSGFGGAGGAGSAGGAGGAAVGGNLSFTTIGTAVVTLGSVNQQAYASAGGGGSGGNGLAGVAGADGISSVTPTDGGDGGTGGTGGTGGVGGEARGGQILIATAGLATGGSFTVTGISQDAGASAGDGGDGGIGGIGGTGGTGGANLNDVGGAIGGNGGAGGSGGDGGIGGVGGAAFGGFIETGNVLGSGNAGGVMDIADLFSDAGAFAGRGGRGGPGGPAGSGGAGGTGAGGAGATGSVGLSDGLAAAGGTGGDATGGLTTLHMRGSDLTIGSVLLASNAFGGDGGRGAGAFEGAIGGNGGSAIGGEASFIANGGTIVGGSITLSAEILGGDGGPGGFGEIIGQSGVGGSSLGGPAGGSLQLGQDEATGAALDFTIADLQISAGAYAGGSSTNGGGNAIGHGAQISFLDSGGPVLAGGLGTATILGDVFIEAVASGGSGTGDPLSANAFGTATGGSATIVMDGGSLAIDGSLQITAAAFGNSTGGSGSGSAFAGVAGVDISGGSFTVTGSTEIFAETNAGTGGAATAAPGTGAFIAVAGVTGPASASFGSLELFAAARAGDVSADGLVGGTARSGDISLFSGTGGTLTVDSLSISARAFGGSSAAGVGGTATASTLQINSGGGSIDITGDVSLASDAFGGIGATANGVAAGGLAYLLAENAGSLTITGTATLSATAGGGTTSPGLVAIVANNAAINLGAASLTAFGDGAVPDGGSLGLVASGLGGSGGTITVDGAVTIDVDTDASLGMAGGGSISIGGALSLTTTRNIVQTLFGGLLTNPGTVLAAGDILFDAGGSIESLVTLDTDTLVSLFSGGGITLGDIASGNSFVLSSSTGGLILGNITSGGSIFVSEVGAIRTGNLVATGGDVEVLSAGNLVVGNVTARNSIFLETDELGGAGTILAGNLDAGGTGPTGITGDGIVIDATGGATIGDIRAQGGVGIASRGGAITTGDITSGYAIGLLAANDVSTGALSAPENIYIADDSMLALVVDTQNGPDVSAVFAATPIQLNGAISISGDVSAGTFQAAGTGAFTATGGMVATSSLTIDSGSLVTLAGLLDAPSVTIGARDIDLQAGIGATLTETITFNVDEDALAVILGGTDVTTPGFQLDAAEMSRLRAADITVFATGNGDDIQNIELQDFTLRGSLAASPNLTGSTLNIIGPDAINVTGAITVTDAAADDTISLQARNIAIFAEQGGRIGLSNASLAPAGIILLDANNVFVGSDSLIQQLQTNINFTGRNDLLATIPASANGEVQLSANTIRATIDNAFLLQNSGTVATRGGFVAGPGGLSIRVNSQSGNATPVDVVINGKTINASGVEAINTFTLETVTFQVSANGRGFNTASTVNGCVINQVCVPPPPPPPEGPTDREIVGEIVRPIPIDVQILSDKERQPLPDDEREQLLTIEAGGGTEASPVQRQEQLVGTRGMSPDVPVEEPITGGGNASLFLGQGREFLGQGRNTTNPGVQP